MDDNGAVLYSEVPAEKLVATFESTVADLGYTRTEAYAGDADVEVRVWTSAERACIGVALPKSLALGLARKLAARLGSPVRVFSVSVVYPASSYDCLLDDLTIRKDGTSSVGRWATDMTSTFGPNWDDVCDGKPYFAVSSILEMAVDDLLPGGERQTHALRAPPSVGNARLDRIASQIRFADRAQLTTVGGRECVRITNEGTTVTSFLETDEAAALRTQLQ